MRLPALVVAFFVAGCGRFGFDALGGDAGAGVDTGAAESYDAAGADTGAAEPDAALEGGSGDDAGVPPEGDAGAPRTWTLGETPGATLPGVTRDGWLCSGNAEELNGGASDYIDGGDGCTGLLRFDLTGLPEGATILDASAALFPREVPTIRGQVAVHRILESWVEGSGDNQRGVANYIERLPGVRWATAGARPPGSSDSTPFHSFDPSELQFQVIPIPAAMVQAWVDDPASNHGIALFGSGYGPPDSQHPHFISSDSLQEALRPTFTVTFRVPGG